MSKPEETGEPRRGDCLHSIIIPAYGASDTLEWCLEGVEEHSCGLEPEVTVVVSGDEAGSRELADRFRDVRFVLAGERLYSGQARNVGAGVSSGRYLVFLDADCRPCEGWLAAIESARCLGYDAICGAQENHDPGSAPGTAEYLISHATYSPAVPAHLIARETAGSANLCVSRDLFDRCGGFPGTERANDYLFSRALHSLGVDIRFEPRSRVVHRNAATAAEHMAGQRMRGYSNAMARFRSGAEASSIRGFAPLAFALFPVRAYRLAKLCIRVRPGSPAEMLRATPLAVAGLLAWTWGFYEAAREYRRSGFEEEPRLPSGWEGYETLNGG